MFVISQYNQVFTRRALLTMLPKQQSQPIENAFLTKFNDITQQFFHMRLHKNPFHPFQIKHTNQEPSHSHSSKAPKTMAPSPQTTQSNAQLVTSPNAASTNPTPKPVTVAAPKAAPRAMGQIFTVSGILEGDEGTDFSPEENREVAEQQVKKVLDEVAVRITLSELVGYEN
jgi:hypothetical protein